MTTISGDAQRPRDSGAQSLSPSLPSGPHQHAVHPACCSPAPPVSPKCHQCGAWRAPAASVHSVVLRPYKNARCQHQRKSFTNICTAGFLLLKWTRPSGRPTQHPGLGPSEHCSVLSGHSSSRPRSRVPGTSRPGPRPTPGFPGPALSGRAIHRPSEIKQNQWERDFWNMEPTPRHPRQKVGKLPHRLTPTDGLCFTAGS